MTVDRLPVREVWVADFEFLAPDGERPEPVCLVARELRSGRLLRLWQDELPDKPPFPTDESTLFVAYMAAAELGCFLQLGWPLPVRILDLYTEFRAQTNGLKLPLGRGLLGAMSVYGLPSITKAEKEAGRALVMRGGPWTAAERAAVLDYCQTDVDGPAQLLPRMLPAILAEPRGLGRALLRGRYMAAVARMEHTGIPIDTATLERLRYHWPTLKRDLVAEVDDAYGVYDGAVFKRDRFAKWLAKRGMGWPVLESGQLALDRDTFKDMCRLYPEVEPLRQVRHALSDLRLEQLAVGSDGRNRAALMPFGAKTGRNTPGSTAFVFGPSTWLRGLVKPQRGRAIAYLDWSAEEVAIAAALSGDERLLEAVQTGDPYLAFAKLAGLAPDDATKDTHGLVRDQCKTCVLGANYGMQAASLAYRIGVTKLEAAHLLQALARSFPVYTEWADAMVDRGMLLGRLESVFGWPVRVTRDSWFQGQQFRSPSSSLRNYPMQTNGAEMLRIACCLATEAGVEVCAPVHDAVLIEAASEDIAEAGAKTRAAMGEASRAVLGGLEVRTSVQEWRWPARYADKRGAAMWERVLGLLWRYGVQREVIL